MYRRILLILILLSLGCVLPLTTYAQVIHEVKSGDSLTQNIKTIQIF